MNYQTINKIASFTNNFTDKQEWLDNCATTKHYFKVMADWIDYWRVWYRKGLQITTTHAQSIELWLWTLKFDLIKAIMVIQCPKNILLSCHKAVQVMKRLAGRIIFRFKVFIQLIMIIKLDLVSFSFIYSNYILTASLYILMYIYIFCKGNNKIMGIIFLFAIKHNVVHLHYIHKFP